jgi:hypothetical protein
MMQYGQDAGSANATFRISMSGGERLETSTLGKPTTDITQTNRQNLLGIVEHVSHGGRASAFSNVVATRASLFGTRRFGCWTAVFLLPLNWKNFKAHPRSKILSTPPHLDDPP